MTITKIKALKDIVREGLSTGLQKDLLQDALLWKDIKKIKRNVKKIKFSLLGKQINNRSKVTEATPSCNSDIPSYFC